MSIRVTPSCQECVESTSKARLVLADATHLTKDNSCHHSQDASTFDMVNLTEPRITVTLEITIICVMAITYVMSLHCDVYKLESLLTQQDSLSNHTHRTPPHPVTLGHCNSCH